MKTPKNEPPKAALDSLDQLIERDADLFGLVLADSLSLWLCRGEPVAIDSATEADAIFRALLGKANVSHGLVRDVVELWVFALLNTSAEPQLPSRARHALLRCKGESRCQALAKITRESGADWCIDAYCTGVSKEYLVS